MSKYAVANREMQFTAGPQKHTFYACAIHRPELVEGYNGLFYPPPPPGTPSYPVDPEDEVECDYCREG